MALVGNAIPSQAFGRYNRVIQYNEPGVQGLIMTPRDVLGPRDQILVTADQLNGPYRVQIQDFPVAGRVDWRGPLPGDVLTWNGPANRVGPANGFLNSGTAIFKGGRQYATTPGPMIGGAAFQASGGTRKLVAIVDETSQTGGPNGIGSGQWRVYVRPEGRNLSGAEISFPDNPDGWLDIGTFDPPSLFNGERWSRFRTWFFNESGTQASVFVPVNELGDTVPDRLFFPVDTPPPPGFLEADPDRCTNRIQLMTVDIDAFAGTVSANIDAQEPVQTWTAVSVSGGCTFTPGNGGNPTGSYSQTDTWNLTGTRRIAVDYKGDTRVFATVEGSGPKTATRSSNFEGTVVLEGTFSMSGKIANTLRIGSVAFDFAANDRAMSVSADSSPGFNGTYTSSESINVGSLSNDFAVGGLPTGEAALYWADLRFDALAFCASRVQIFRTTGGTARLVSFAQCSAAFSVLRDAPNEEAIAGPIRGFFEGAKVFEYQPAGVATSGVGPSNVAGVHIVTAETCCPFDPGSATPIETHVSLDSFASRDDAGFSTKTLGQGYGVDENGNGAMSNRTLRDQIILGAPFIGPPPGYLNFISGDDLQDVMNQVEYPEGPLGVDTRQDIGLTRIV